METRDIGWAVRMLKEGRRVRRTGWNGQGMWLEIQNPGSLGPMTVPFVYMKTADQKLVPWLCSQTDLLAVDFDFASAE